MRITVWVRHTLGTIWTRNGLNFPEGTRPEVDSRLLGVSLVSVLLLNQMMKLSLGTLPQKAF